MIAHIQFRHLGEDISSLLIFNFGAVKDVIVVVPEEPAALEGWSGNEKDEGIVFNKTSDDLWVCPQAGINRFPETFIALKNVLQTYFNGDKFCFCRRY